MKNNFQLLYTLSTSQASWKVSLPSPSPFFFGALSDEPTPTTSQPIVHCFAIHAWISWLTNDPSIPHLPQVYNTYSVVNFTSIWKQYPKYDNKAYISLLLQQVMENTSSLQDMIYNYKAKHYCLFDKWWKHDITFIVQHATKNKTRHHCFSTSDGKHNITFTF